MQQSLSQEAVRSCTRCGIEKPLTSEHFQVDRQKSIGFRPDCKACRHAVYATKAPEAPKLRNRALAVVGLKFCSTCLQELPQSIFPREARNADGISCKCRSCLSAARRAARLADPEAFDSHAKAYKERNREKVRQRAAEYARQRRARDGAYKFRGAVSNLVATILKKRGGSKGGQPFFEAVGYTKEQLIAHVERQFLPGMSWQNHGEWHLDHILPNAQFQYRSMSDADFRLCWALSNLRPLWKIDNLKKSSKVETLL